MTTFSVKETHFGDLQIGAQFQSGSGALWFKRSTKTAVGLQPHQGPLGRHWDFFPKSQKVRGEVKADEV